jgi:predicted CoA-substrate-specific enzyme activase
LPDLGVDIGSISVNTILLEDDNVLEEHYDFCRGRPFHVLRARLADVLSRWGNGSIATLAFTGTGGSLAARLLGGVFVNEIVAQSASVCRLYPQARTVIEMGGEDTKLITLKNAALSDFVMNGICAAGTGSFLDQQARRINVPIVEEFGRLALRSKDPPRIAGRCSVFAKSDMIHLQQIATPVHDIIAGLCFAVARNVRSTLARGRDLEPPVVFQGGVAANAGMVRAFREVFGLRDGDLIVPPHHASMGAMGALYHLREHPPDRAAAFRGLDELDRHLDEAAVDDGHLEPLAAARTTPCNDAFPLPRNAEAVPGFLGVDVGSLSTNVVLIDACNRVIARRYLPTAGRPLEAIQRGVREIGEEVGARVAVRAAGATGSGRYLTGDFVGADLIVNEITAQATAAVSIDPQVDTIFEIGGQDSKYVSLSNGVVVDFEMNKVCAAGTGSFLEEQAEKLGVSIVEEFGSIALGADAPARLGDRCTVFMESDLNARQQKGATRENLIGGLAYSIVQNYLTKVVGEKPVGNRIFFQGGVAYNRAVVSAFEKVTGRTVTVPPNFDVTGAIGAAMLARDAMDGRRTRFKGFSIAERAWSMDRFTCKSCANHCEIHRVRVDGESRPLSYGGRCERHEAPERKNRGEGIPDLFEERTRLLLDGFVEDTATHESDKSGARPTVVGIPRSLSVFHQRFPFWRAFFEALGMRVVLSRRTDPALISRSLESLTAETCFPVELTHGHVLDLLEKGVDAVFLPFVVNEEAEADNPTTNCNCPWIQTYPFMVRAGLADPRDADKLLVPALHFRHSRRLLREELSRFMGDRFGASACGIARAVEAGESAQESFTRRVRDRGKEVLASLPPGKTAAVMLGRPYNMGDPALNLHIVEKLLSLGVLPIPLDFLPLEQENIFSRYPSMYWPNGRRMLQAARITAADDRLQAIYVGNFRCGPDSFLSHFIRREMRGKPYLQLEMDEHSADAGLVTRLEAFRDSLRSRSSARAQGRARPAADTAHAARPAGGARGRDAPQRTLYFPPMADGAYALAAACRHCGLKADVLPPLSERDLALGRANTSSRECFPMITTTGSFLRKLMEPGVDPAAMSFFMPDHNGPCRFGQYNILQRIIFDRLGFQEASIVHPSNENSYADLVPRKGLRFRLAVWRGIIAVDVLRKLLQERRPYELHEGAALSVYREQLDRAVRCIERGGWGIGKVIRGACEAFARVEVVQGARKPVISVIGEIYMRDNPFCNGHMVERLEALGAETLIGPIREWITFSTNRYARDSRRNGRTLDFLRSRLQGLVQHAIEERLVHIAAEGGVETFRDQPLEKMMELSAAYIHRDYDGDPVIALGSAAGQAGTGISGIVNILPFTCLPGTVITAASPQFCRDHDGIPWINIAYDGQEDSSFETRLQAFVHRAKEYSRLKGYDRPRTWTCGHIPEGVP